MPAAFIAWISGDAHHLVPKSKGGRPTTCMHRVCHHQSHAVLTETELARQYASVEALLAYPELKVFVAWIKTKPDGLFVSTRKSGRVRERWGAGAAGIPARSTRMLRCAGG
jgi:hypothetical protein